MGKIENVLILSSPNPYKTAGTVAYNLFKNFTYNGFKTKLLVKAYDKYEEKDVICLDTFYDNFLNRVKKKLKKILTFRSTNTIPNNPDYHILDYDQRKQYYKTKRLLKKIKFKPDAIIFLFPQNFINAKNLFELNKATGAPIYWYLMDSSALTGGCHYSWDCERYKVGCGECPGLYSTDANDQTAMNFKFKYKYLKDTDISVVTGTEWQFEKAKESMLFRNKPIYKTLISIDKEIFKPKSKIEAKKRLEIEPQKKVIFLGAAFLNEKRKGIKIALTALKYLQENKLFINDEILLVVAGNNLNYVIDDITVNYKYLGVLSNNEPLAEVFQASDVFLCPSIQDSGPMMINQAIMSGTPVVSFEMGAALDLVHKGKTGYRAKNFDYIDFANGIKYILELDHEQYLEMSNNCRKVGISQFSQDAAFQNFEKIINTKA